MDKLKNVCSFRILLSAFVIHLLLPSLLLAFNNEPNNFRGIKWGTNITELTDMIFVENQSGGKVYRRKSDKKKIGAADLADIQYVFYKDRFLNVAIIYNGLGNHTQIIETYNQLYGAGKKPNRYMESYLWVGKDIDIMLYFNDITNRGQIFYEYNKLSKEREINLKKKAKAGAGDL